MSVVCWCVCFFAFSLLRFCLQFAVMYAARCCDGLQLERMQVIDAIAKAVPQARARLHAHLPTLRCSCLPFHTAFPCCFLLSLVFPFSAPLFSPPASPPNPTTHPADVSLSVSISISVSADTRAQPHKVCLDNPDLAILVEVVKSACCLSVLRDYYALCKYNIRVIAMPPDQRPEAPGCGERRWTGSRALHFTCIC